MHSVLKTLSEYKSFYMSKNILLVFKIVECLQSILKPLFLVTSFRICFPELYWLNDENLFPKIAIIICDRLVF